MNPALCIIFPQSSPPAKATPGSEAGKRKAVDGQLPEISLAILEFVKSRGRITVKDIVALSNANRNTVKKHLENLVENNYLG